MIQDLSTDVSVQEDNDSLLVRIATAKKVAHSSSMRLGDHAIQALNNIAITALMLAIERARDNGRRTLKPCDF